MRETKRINAIFLDTPALGDFFVNADRQTIRIPEYEVVRIGKTVKLQGVGGNLDFIVSVTKNARFSFRRIDKQLPNEV